MAATKRDYYEILRVNRTASGDDISRAYRRLALAYHPDRNGGNGAGAETRFKQCAVSYGIVSDCAKRRRYDRLGQSGGTGRRGFSHMDVSGIFSMLDDIFG